MLINAVLRRSIRFAMLSSGRDSSARFRATVAPLDASPVAQLRIERQTKLIARDRQYHAGVRIPAECACANLQCRFDWSGSVGEGPTLPAIAVRQNARRDSERRQRRVLSENDECSAALARSPRQANSLRDRWFGTGEHHHGNAPRSYQHLGPRE